jgi:hypothetical protein
MPNWLTYKQMANAIPGLSTGGLRADLWNRKRNGLEARGAVIRRGRNILIDADIYVDWMREKSSTYSAQGKAV